MTQISPPPIQHNVILPDGKATQPWVLFFNQLFEGDTGTAWNPAFTSLTEVGIATKTGIAYKVIQRICVFFVTIIPATSVSATAGTTYISNLPFQMRADGFCIAVSGNVGSNAGMCNATDQRIYIPGLSAVTVPTTIIGVVPV